VLSREGSAEKGPNKRLMIQRVIDKRLLVSTTSIAYWKYHWVLAVHRDKRLEELLTSLAEKVIACRSRG
jgi:hypothetical protein